MYQPLTRNFKCVLGHRKGFSLCMTRTIGCLMHRPGLVSCCNIVRPRSDSHSHNSVSMPRPRLYVANATCNNNVFMSKSSSICTSSCASSTILSIIGSNKDEVNMRRIQWKYRPTQTSGHTNNSNTVGLKMNDCRQVRVLRELLWNENRRLLHTGFVDCCTKPEKSESDNINKGHIQTQEQTAAEDPTSTSSLRSIAPTNFDRKILVWTGKYSSFEAVPMFVSASTLNWAKNKFRVYVSIGMIVATFFTAGVMMAIGRRRAARGESLSKMNMMRHPHQYQEHLDKDSLERSQ